MTDELRRLRAEQLRARAKTSSRSARRWPTYEIAELRKRIPTTQRQAAAPIVGSRPTDPLERLFAALRPN